MYVLNKDFYPETWNDDERMGILMAEFRIRSLNPDNYDSKMKFWKEMITKYADYKGSSNISILELKSVFKRKGTSPYCLADVLDDMQKNKQMIIKDSFLEANQDTWSWVVDSLIKKPVKWGFNKIMENLVLSSPIKDESTEYISFEILVKQAISLESYLEKNKLLNKIITLKEILGHAASSGLTTEGVSLIITHLKRTNSVVVETNPDDEHKTLLKFAGTNFKANPITDIERSIHNMEETENNLLKIIENTEKDIETVMSSVRNCIKDGKRLTAKNYLKKKHILEKNLEKKLNVLENVQIMLARIHDSQSDKNVIEAYKIGSQALKNAFANSGVTLDSVDDTIAEMKEIMEQQDEIKEMISSPQANDIDELELEQELSDLLDQKLMESGDKIVITTPQEKDLALIDDEIEKRLEKLKSDFSSPDKSIDMNLNINNKDVDVEKNHLKEYKPAGNTIA